MRHTLLRTEKKYAEYEAAKRAGADSSFLNNGRKLLTWAITENQYPYDAIASQHDLLHPARKVANWNDLTQQELEDFGHILTTLRKYDAVLYNINHAQTVRDWLHVHLLVFTKV